MGRGKGRWRERGLGEEISRSSSLFLLCSASLSLFLIAYDGYFAAYGSQKQRSADRFGEKTEVECLTYSILSLEQYDHCLNKNQRLRGNFILRFLLKYA